MKTSIIIIRILIALMIALSLMETFYEYDVVFTDGSSYYDNKTKEDIIIEEQNWNTSLIFLVLLLLFLQWKVKNINTVS